MQKIVTDMMRLKGEDKRTGVAGPGCAERWKFWSRAGLDTPTKPLRMGRTRTTRSSEKDAGGSREEVRVDRVGGIWLFSHY